jgi:hypothetical protein
LTELDPQIDHEEHEVDGLDENDSLYKDGGETSRDRSSRRRPTILKPARAYDALGHEFDEDTPTGNFERWVYLKRKRIMIGFIVGGALMLLIAVMFAKQYLMRIEGGLSPPWYPTPLGGTVSNWKDSYEKAAKMVNKMSILEKVNITTGVGWSMGLCVGNTGPAIAAGFPALCLQDGPLGIRLADNITAFPAALTAGATWNRDLMYRRGNSHGKEAFLKGVNVLLGPSMVRSCLIL